MKLIQNFFRYLAKGGGSRARKRDESYLAESADIHEREYRLRELKR